MYTLKVSYGYVDDPEAKTAEVLGTYEDRDEAAEAAESKFSAIMDDLSKDCELYFGEVEGSRYAYYVTYGYADEYNCLIAGYTHFYAVDVNER